MTSYVSDTSTFDQKSGDGSTGVVQFRGNRIRRTASLGRLPCNNSLEVMILHMDKSTQTEESYFDRLKSSDLLILESSSTDIQIEKLIRQRWHKFQRCENSVSIQTQSPIHASPVAIPITSGSQNPTRPMRSSVEGLNQEIEKLVLCPRKSHANRNEFCLNSIGTPEGHRAPVAELFHSDMRSVNTQTPVGNISSDESQNSSPENPSQFASASPRINRFLAREPPDGCEKVLIKINEGDQGKTNVFKPCVGFQLKPSQGSAFQALQPIELTDVEVMCKLYKD